MSGLIRYLIARPLLTNIILVFVILLAGTSFFRVQRQGYPRVDLGRMDINTVFPGASPEDVELNVTVKIEESLKEIIGIDYYSSVSMENMSMIQVYLDPDAENKEKVKADIRRAVDGVIDLPAEVEKRPQIAEHTVDNMPVYEVAMSMSGADERLLRAHARRLKRHLLDLDFVARVQESGVRDREIRVLLNREKMSGKYVSFDEVIRSIQLNKLRLSGGSLESYTSEKGLVTLSEFDTPRDVENIIVRSNFLGNRLRIGDIGHVEDGFKKADTLLKFDGRKGVSLWVTKKTDADVIRSVQAIKKVIEEYRVGSAPEGMRFHSTFDASIETENRLSIVYSNAAIGLLLVVLILFLFLDPKIALWTAAGIPISVGVTLMILPVLGITLNSISLLGMVVVLGMLVDDAIIIAESIYRCRESGMGAIDSAVRGLSTVVRPVLGTITTTIIAFLPMYFIPGMVGDFSVEVPTIVILMLVASFLEATMILPVHLGYERENKMTESDGRGSGSQWKPPGQRLIRILERIYDRLLRWSLRRRYTAILIYMVFLIAGGIGGVLLVKVDMFPIDTATKIWISAQLPRGSNLESSNRASEKLEKIIEAFPTGVVHSYKTTVGIEYDPSADMARPVASSYLTHVILTPASDREISAVRVRETIKEKMKDDTEGGRLKLNFMIEGGGPPVGRPLEIRILGQDQKERLQILERLRRDLEELQVIDIDTDYRLGKKEVRLLPDYPAVAAAQLNVAAIASTIRTAFDGSIVTYLQTPDERIPFRVLLDERSKDFRRPLDDLYVRNITGNLVPLKQLVRVEEGRSPEAYFHYNSYRANKITGDIDREKTDINQVYQKLRGKYRDFGKKHPGFKLVLGGEAEKSAEFMNFMLLAFFIALVAIYLLLVVQFNSFTQPSMVIMAIPFGLVGIVLAFGLQRLELSMLALIGIIGFMGVVVNDSLIMVDFINRLRARGTVANGGIPPAGEKREGEEDQEEFIHAVANGARLRLRPIVLTTVTTLAGFLPTAYGLIGGFDSFVSPMVMAMTWGLLTGTVGVLLTIPAFYVVNEDLIRLVAKLRRRL